MRWYRWTGSERRRARRILLCAMLLLVLGLPAAGVWAQGAGAKQLQLEVFINGNPAKLISSFTQLPDGSLAAARSELEELGIQVPKSEGAGLVPLAGIPTLTYKYVEAAQKILITIADAQRIPRRLDPLQDAAHALAKAQAGWGSVLNYQVLATASSVEHGFASNGWLNASSLALDARLFSPYGTFTQSAILRSTHANGEEFIRLDTAYRYSSQELLIAGTAGDFVSGGLAWTRPVRMAGVQAQHSFALRPDLITMPLPTLTGSAAVPSTVDVFVNNVKTYSQEVPAGPFSIANVPLVTGNGTAMLVVRDATGRETRTALPLYASGSLLAPGKTSWSVEMGVPRLNYGSGQDTYASQPLLSASARRGLADWLTVESHVEMGAGLANGGVGFVANAWNLGVLSAAMSGSTMGGSFGAQTYAAFETKIAGMSVALSSMRAIADYNDLASATAQLQWALNSGPTGINFTFRPTREQERITLGAPVPFDEKASWSLSFVHQYDGLDVKSNIVAASYSRSLPHGTSMFATAFQDSGSNRSFGFVVGFSMPLGEAGGSAVTSVSRSQGSTMVNATAVRPLANNIGAYGWDVQVRQADANASYYAGSAAYRSGFMTAKVGASQTAGSTSVGVDLKGSIAFMGGRVFFSDWIDDSFAVVDVGIPGVRVSHENRLVGETNADGLLLVPGLRSFQRNAIAIDPVNMPIDVELSSTNQVVMPADKVGVQVKYKLERSDRAALVSFVRKDGSFIPAGAAGVSDKGEEFTVGYDGEAFIRNAEGITAVTIEYEDVTCKAQVAFTPRAGEQVRVGPVECR